MFVTFIRQACLDIIPKAKKKQTNKQTRNKKINLKLKIFVLQRVPSRKRKYGWKIVTVFIDWDLVTGVDKKKDAGNPSLEWNKGTLFAETHAYISSIKWLLSH